MEGERNRLSHSATGQPTFFNIAGKHIGVSLVPTDVNKSTVTEQVSNFVASIVFL